MPKPGPSTPPRRRIPSHPPFDMRPLPRRRRSCVAAAIGAVLFALYTSTRFIVHQSPQTAATTAANGNGELLPVYDLPPSFPAEPTHLTSIDPSRLVPNGSMSIDAAHRNGNLHTGSVLYVMDASGAFLFLQRSSDVVTCPGTWSILGEHSTTGEGALETVVRGLEEELGFASRGVERSAGRGGGWTAELRPVRGGDDAGLRVTIRNATEFPLYYIRHYGPRNGNRVDRQLTYLWLVRFPKTHGEIRWQLDDEVANHKWLSLDEVRSWLLNDAKKDNRAFKADGGVRDDGPDEGDFCHRTIRSLYEAGLTSLAKSRSGLDHGILD